MKPSKQAPVGGAKAAKRKYPTLTDFARLNTAAMANLESVVKHFAPNGKLAGREYMSLNPRRADSQHGSFRINLDTGKWADFAEDVGGGDIVSWITYVTGAEHQSEGLRELASFLGLPAVGDDNPASGSTATDLRQPASNAEPRPIMPIPQDALATKPIAHPSHGRPSRIWTYRDAAGGLLLEVWRFDPASGHKQFSPLTYWHAGDWKWKSSPAPRPLYGLDRLAAQSEAPVLITEGEKATDAARELLPDHVCVTTMNGAQSPDKSDFSPLRGRQVRIWADHDEPGARYARTCARLALEAGAASVELLDLTSLAVHPLTDKACDLPKGWDAADALAAGWRAETLAARVRWEAYRQKPHLEAAGLVAEMSSELPEGFELDPDGASHKRPGLYFTQIKNRTSGTAHNGPTHSVERIWLCAPMRVTALCRNHESCGWGRVLLFVDRDGRPHRVVVDLAMLAGSGEGLRALLLGHGLEISTLAEARRRLMDFILLSHPSTKVRVTHRTGWHDGAFVLPDRTIGPSGADPVIFQSEAEAPALTCRGSLSQWQSAIARYAPGNHFLAFAIAVALAPPLLEFTGGDGCIFHLRGRSTATSSSGKTTLQRVAVSVAGAPDTLRRWRLTDNSLEAACESFNDLCLVLDELAQLDPRAAGDAAYLIAHGEGKGRMGRAGEARPMRRWRTLGLSSGEISLEQHMALAERKHKAG